MIEKIKIPGLLLAFLLCSAVAQAGIIEQAGGTSFRNLGFYYPGQTFTAEEAWLGAISFEMKNGTITEPASELTVGLYDWDGDTDALGSLIATGTNINALPVHQGPNIWVDFDFSGTSLDSGAEYAAVFTSPSEDLWDYGVIWNSGEDTNALYANGSALWGTDRVPDENGYDLNFRVNTSPVPVPAAVWLLASGLAALFGLKRRAQ